MGIELVDTHCHFDFHLFDDDREAVLRRAAEAGVQRIIVPGLDVDSSRAVASLAQQTDGVFAAVGAHPNAIGPNPAPISEALAALRALAAQPGVVAVGEIGLDYHWDTTPRDVQRSWLEAQLALAAELGLPVILHNREATADLLAVLTAWVQGGLPQAIGARPGVLHSFSAAWPDAEQALALGFYLGFTGPLTFPQADEMRRVAASAPADRLLVETDAPFLAPHPHRGRRNEPAFVRYVAERLAEIRATTLEEVAAQTTRNACALFGWQPPV